MKLKKIQYILILTFIMVGMLFFGLRLKGDDPSNKIEWEREGGLIFQVPSLAYTKKGFSLPGAENELTIDLTLKPDYLKTPAFQIILLVYNGNKEEQLLVGIWDHALMVMNGTDYSDEKKEPKLYVPLGGEERAKNIRISSTPEGTTVFLEGNKVRESSDLVLTMPQKEARLILGSDIESNNSWTGTLYNLKLSGDQNKPVEYDFSCTPAELIKDRNGTAPALQIPSNRPIMEKKFLTLPHLKTTDILKLLSDIFINLVGFIPLGVILFLVIGENHKYALPLACILAFLFSLYLETVQIWIPTRNSSALDLVLNSLGGFMGVLAVKRLGVKN